MFSAHTWRRVHDFFRRTPGAVALLVFVLAFALATWLQLHDAFADPDSFYHARMATLIRDQGLPRSFPWLPFTSLAETYVDQHFLYHVLLIPFVSLVSPLAGIKVATVFLAAVMATVFYSALRAFRTRGAFVVTLLLLAVNPFMFRMGLAKTPSLAVALLFIGLWLLFSFRFRWLFLFAWFYVWVYGGFSLLLVAAGCSAVAGEIVHWIRRRRDERSALTRWFSELIDRSPAARPGLYARGFFAVLLGITAGLVLNPQFPTNVRFYESQLVKIGIVNYQKTIGVGGEWYPYPIGELIPGTVFVSILLLLGLLALSFEYRRQSARSWALFLLTVFLFFMTLKSRRYVEYYVPVAMAFSAFAISDALRGKNARELTADVRQLLRHRVWTRIVAVFLVLYVGIGATGVAVRDLRGVRRDLAGGQKASTLQGAATWLKTHAPANAIIVHSDWDEFPLLFYYDTTHRYIAGLDATFLYDHDPDRYWKWVKITTGEADPKTVYPTIRIDLDSSYVLLTKDHTAMDALLQQTAGVRLVYEDDEAKIYRLLD